MWAEERDIADAATLADAAGRMRPAGGSADAAAAPRCRQPTTAYTQQAIDAGVFGSPSYVIDGEIFWGQDRLDFVERRLAAPG